MPNDSAVSASEALLTSLMQQVVHLDLRHLEQLYVHLGEMIEQMTPMPVSSNSSAAEVTPASTGVLASLRLQYGEGYLEWKQIRQGDKVYGPYPYWRFLCNGKRHSIYLKDLAQELRQVAPLDEIGVAVPSVEADPATD